MEGTRLEAQVASGDVARVSQASELRRDRGVAVADVRISRRAAAYESKRVPVRFGWGCVKFTV